jgi:TatA/E family protein of Tat protein translocase
MGNIGFQELLVIFLIALFVIGPKKLPALARALGEAIRTFQDELKNDHPKNDNDSHPKVSD